MNVKIQKSSTNKSFIELISENLHINFEKIKKFQEEARRENKNLLQYLIEQGFPEEKIAKIKAEYLGYTYDDLSNYYPQPELIHAFNETFLRKRMVLPLNYNNRVLTIAMVEPSDIMTLNEVINILKNEGFIIAEVNIIVTTRDNLLKKIDIVFENEKQLENFKESSLKQEKEKDVLVEQNKKVEVDKELEKLSANLPIVVLANKIIEYAYKKGASDIHIQPEEEKVAVRCRIDGDLMEILSLPKNIHDSLVTRYKIMCNMKIDERRLPQDARINYAQFNPEIDIDLRVSTVPTVYGEDVVMRILDKGNAVLELDKLGFTEENLELYRNAIKKPYGMILLVGPTGSGKTTALYSALKEIDTPEKKIITVEDPVEYTLGGTIVQTSINPSAGYTFDKALRAFLRHDPDVILVGEIRDPETAKIAVEASLTGHLVFSTLHTNDSINTVIRLGEMGIESYLIGDSLLLVIAQRLAKRICPNCKVEYKPDEKEKIIIKEAGFDVDDNTVVYKGEGCEKCNYTGYKGRVGIQEVLKIDKDMKDLLLQDVGIDVLREKAIQKGLKTLRQDGVIKALKGITTLDQVVKTTIE